MLPARTPSMLACAALLACLHGAAGAQQVPGRGQLLYEAHCAECHTTQMHWRENRVARDWDALRTQVHAWQGRLRLNWPPDDVDAVARYLNDSIYRHPLPRDQAGMPPGNALASGAGAREAK